MSRRSCASRIFLVLRPCACAVGPTAMDSFPHTTHKPSSLLATMAFRRTVARLSGEGHKLSKVCAQVAALLSLATLRRRLPGLQEYVHEVGLQPSHLTRHPVLTGGELQDGLL